MKRYRTYTARKLKLPRRLLFFFAVAAIIFSVTVIVGNVLKRRVEKTVSQTDSEVTALETKKAQADTVMQSAEHDEALLSVCAGHLDTAGITDAAGVKSVISSLRDSGFNTVSFTVCYDSGNLSYASPSLQSMTRLTASEKLFSYELLKSAAGYARESGMRMSAVLTASSNSEADCAVAKELYDAGFDEIIVTGFEGSAPDDSSVSLINTYCESLRKVAPVDYGVLLSADLFKNSKNAPFIEKIFAKTEFLAIDLRQYGGEDAAALADSLRGSFNAYLLRPLISGASSEGAAVRAALKGRSVIACQFISSPPKSTAETTSAETDAKN